MGTPTAFCTGLLALIMGAQSLHAEPPKPRPNVIIVITDDQGYGDLSCHGNPILKTPNLDRLALQSVRLDDYHAYPYCVPSRAALLTGKYADRTGVHNHLEPHWFVHADESMLSNMFRDAGYATGMFGKWHLGDNHPYRPMDRGFDETLRHHGGAVGTLADHWDNCYVDDTYYQNGKPTKVEGYCSDVFFGAATRFIEKCAGDKKPFFLYLATNAPHGPQICPPSYSKPYAGTLPGKTAKFFGMIANIDENVGKLRDYLQDLGLAEDTVFIFTTDNGTAGGAGVFNAGMRGNKGDSYDGGHRVPFFLHWPAGGFDRERRIETLTAQIDIAPTLLDLCGIPAPHQVRFDGVSLRPLLEKGDHPGWPERIVMTDGQQKEPPKRWAQTAVMTERWRLVNGKELYDIDADPGQKKNLFDQHPEVVERLTEHYDALWDDLQPAINRVAEISIGDPAAPSVALNYHDCIGRHMFWFQDGIRSLNKGRFRGQPVRLIDAAKREGKRAPAFWPVNVATEGEYRIELRRWPAEVDAPIHADIPAGEPVYGQSAQRTKPGRGFPAVKATLSVGDQQLTTQVGVRTKAAVFKTTLKAGSQHLSAKFHAADRRSLDAFYVYVSKVD